MDGFKSIQMFLILMIPFTALIQHRSSVTVRVGDEATLSCEDVKDLHDKCYSTTWILSDSTNRPTVTLFEYGKIHREAAAKADRLRVTEKCSLVIKKVTVEDVGRYVCRQFISGQTYTDSLVDLSVINSEEKMISSLNSSCRDVKGEDTPKRRRPPPTTTITSTRPTTRSTTTQPPPPPKTTTTTTTKVNTTSEQKATNPGCWSRFILVLVGVAALSVIVVSVNIWTRTKGYKTHRGNKQHNDEDDDVVIYEDVEDVRVPVRFHRSTNQL